MAIAVIDYGMGNIHSVAKALEVSGARVLVTNKASEIKSCRKVVLPGVGAFDDAMSELEARGLTGVIKECANIKKPLLGICLGMQLFFERSQEAKIKPGLGILPGSVVKFDAKARRIKVPHMGWNALKVKLADCPLLSGINDREQVYFCHSYYPQPRDLAIVAGVTDYALEFASVAWKDKVYGAQFHPEKSQGAGLRIMKNFVELC